MRTAGAVNIVELAERARRASEFMAKAETAAKNVALLRMADSS